MNLEKLKDTARKYEQKEDWRKAIEVYRKAIDEFESGREAHPDLSLYNRVGDLYIKISDATAAVRAYERAVDLYADQGFLNNAIALCGKILRVNPGRTPTYLKLAQLHARKNVVYEAKRNLIEYIERMNATSQLDEAFKAVKEFADKFSSNQDIRLMLVELLRAASRDDEAREQLEKMAQELEARGDNDGARKTRERLHAIDSSDGAEDDSSTHRKNDLVFLDTGISTIPPRPAPPPRPARITPLPVAVPAAALAPLIVDPAAEPIDEFEAMDFTGYAEPAAAERSPAESTADTPPLPDFERTSFEPPALVVASVVPLDGLMRDEPMLEVETAAADPEAGLQLDAVEPTELAVGAEPLDGLERIDASGLPAQAVAGLVNDDGESLLLADFALDDAPGPGTDGMVELDFIALEEASPDEDDLDFADDGDDSAGPAIVASSIDELEDRILDDPENPDLHRELAAALRRDGDTSRAVDELDLAMIGYEGQREWLAALDIADDLVQLQPDGVHFFQKRVELAYHTGDRPRLLDTYLDLGDLLVRLGAVEKALSVYGRVTDHDPDNLRARNAIGALTFAEMVPPREPATGFAEEWEPEVPPAAEGADSPEAASVGAAHPAADVYPPPEEWVLAASPSAMPAVADDEPAPDHPAPPLEPASEAPLPFIDSAPASAAPAAAVPLAARPHTAPMGTDDWIDLGSMIFEEQAPRDTRMRVGNEQPTGDEQRDFDEMLQQFKRGIEENLDTDDYEAHYDLGVAFKEMGLLDEAIAEFQKALRAPDGRLRTSEALGVSFFDKGQFAIAEAVLRRAVDGIDGGDDAKIGLIYWQGRSAEAQGKTRDALASYERALAVDIRFMDLGERVPRLTADRPA